MIRRSTSFGVLKVQTQTILDYSVLVCTDEIFEFHGGEAEMSKFLMNKLLIPTSLSAEEMDYISKLRKKFKKEHSDRFRKYSSLMSDAKFIWPSQKFALYGLEQVIGNRKRWKSVDIPGLITKLLLFNLEESDKEQFHSLRDTRNKIAHGKSLKYDLSKAIDANYFLYSLASKIDEHTINNFFITERFRR